MVLVLLICVYICAALPPECGSFTPPQVPQIDTTGYNLLQVSLVFRHGDRIMYQDAPCWPNDQGVYQCQDRYLTFPSFSESRNTTSSGILYRKKYMDNRNYYAGSCETGQLTNRGYVQEYEVGKMYKKLYVDSGFIPETFNPKDVYLRSDEGDRCVQSLETMLQGMFPTQATSKDYVIYDINTMDSYYDNIVPNWNICPIYESYIRDAFLTPQYQQFYNERVVPLYANLSIALGYDVDSYEDIEQIHDCLVVHACHEQPIPSGVTDLLFAEVMQVETYSYKAIYNYPDPITNAKAGIGYFLQELVSQMLPALGQGSGPVYKMLFFSGHDTTVMPILSAFQQWDGLWAMYASQMQFEIYQNQTNSSDYKIRIAYNGRNILVPGCSGALCDWNTFYSYVSTLFPDNNC